MAHDRNAANYFQNKSNNMEPKGVATYLPKNKKERGAIFSPHYQPNHGIVQIIQPCRNSTPYFELGRSRAWLVGPPSSLVSQPSNVWSNDSWCPGFFFFFRPESFNWAPVCRSSPAGSQPPRESTGANTWWRLQSAVIESFCKRPVKK